MSKLDTGSEVSVFYEPDYTQADICVKRNNAKVVFIEASETGVYDVMHCLDICAKLREEVSGCKLILMCPEQDEEAVAQTVSAKHNGDIDDFVFYEASFEYLSSKILTMMSN